MPIFSSLRFWLYFPFLIPSIICSIFILYHLLFDRVLRRSLNNHIIVVILFIGLFYQLTDVICLVYYYYNHIALISTPGFCLIWIYIDVAGFVTILILVTWASIERHILIFHDNWLLTSRKRIYFHYIPLIIFTLYPLGFYAYIIFIISCSDPVDYNIIRCGYSYCAVYIPTIGIFDGIVNNVMPTFIIAIFSILLLVRVIWQKLRLHQPIQWHNYRKMAVQLLSISSIYLFVYFPMMILYVLYASGVPLNYNALDYYGSNLYFMPHIIMCIPFVNIISLPELRAKFKICILFRRRQRNIIAPSHTAGRRLITCHVVTVLPNVQ